VQVRCPNRSCPMQILQSLMHFTSVLDIEGLGEKTIARLYELGLVRNVADIYSVTAEQLLELDGFQETLARKLAASIEASKAQSWSRVLAALGIRHVGWVTSEAVAAVLPSVDALRAASEEQLAAAEGVGPVVAASLMDFLSSEANQETLERLRAAGLTMAGAAAPVSADGPLNGRTVVITGGLEAYSREEAKRAVVAAGGKTTESISRKTSFLVAGREPGTKLAKAESLGVPILDEAAFLAVLGGERPSPDGPGA
jgi:DNA ligase (NAD+)